MKLSLNIFFLLIIFSVSCAQLKNKNWNPQKNNLTKQIHQEILEELKNKNIQKRVPASDKFLSQSFDRLKYFSPGKFEIYVFPKISSLNSKDEENETHLGSPRLFETSILGVSPCHKFIEDDLFKKYRPVDIFPIELAKDRTRNCAIIEIENKSLTGISKSLLKQDDQLVVRLFIDDQFVIHGVDQINYLSRGDFRIIRRIIEKEETTAGLSFFPMDLPISKSIIENTEPSDYFRQMLDPIAIFQIQNRYSKDFKRSECSGKIYRHNDPFGGVVEIGWCNGAAWPTYLENSRYFSVTSQKKVDP